MLHDHANHNHNDEHGHSSGGHAHAPANFGRAFVVIGITLDAAYVLAERSMASPRIHSPCSPLPVTTPVTDDDFLHETAHELEARFGIHHATLQLETGERCAGLPSCARRGRLSARLI